MCQTVVKNVVNYLFIFYVCLSFLIFFNDSKFVLQLIIKGKKKLRFNFNSLAMESYKHDRVLVSCNHNSIWLMSIWLYGFVCRVHVVSTNEYLTIWVNFNLTCLLNRSKFLNSNTTHLLNGLVMSTCLSDFIKTKRKNKF